MNMLSAQRKVACAEENEGQFEVKRSLTDQPVSTKWKLGECREHGAKNITERRTIKSPCRDCYGCM